MTAGEPVVISGLLENWAAMDSGERPWSDLRRGRLRQVAGLRTVPVEVGLHHRGQGGDVSELQQNLMTLNEYLDYCIDRSVDNCRETVHTPKAPAAISSVVPVTAARTKAYLAQHRLLDQVPELNEDLGPLKYLELGERAKQAKPPIRSIWLGPAETVTPLHFDWHDNLLVQIFGTKQLILYPASCTDALYPMEGVRNASRLDPESPDYEAFPKSADVLTQRQVCVLQPGEVLYIPRCYWHHVKSLSLSASISFWF